MVIALLLLSVTQAVFTPEQTIVEGYLVELMKAAGRKLSDIPAEKKVLFMNQADCILGFMTATSARLEEAGLTTNVSFKKICDGQSVASLIEDYNTDCGAEILRDYSVCAADFIDFNANTLVTNRSAVCKLSLSPGNSLKAAVLAALAILFV